MEPIDPNQEIMISVYLKRDCHENGMTLQEYADRVIAGTVPALSHDEFVYQFGALEDYVKLVCEWATANGLTVTESHCSTATVKLTGTVNKLNELFGTTLVSAPDGSRTHVGDIKIPTDIDNVVDLVLGFDTTATFRNRAIAYKPETFEHNVFPTKVSITPTQIATAYNLPPGDGHGGCIGIIELTYGGYQTGYSSSDLIASFSRIGITTPSVVKVSIDGAVPLATSDSESMLDLYCAGAIAPKAKIVYYTAPNSAQGLLDCINAIVSDTVHNPSAIGISWGGTESSDYLNSAFAACVAKGIACFCSAGDDGASNLVPDYPASCPYVISAGGTTVYLNGDDSVNTEHAWSSTGGGISNINNLPSWQSGLSYQTYSTSGGASPVTPLTNRGYPDMSAPADPSTGYQFYINGVLSQYGGTSAAAPLLAGMWVRLNQLLQKRIGADQATFYANLGLFNDITTGNNALTQTGYITRVGWDPVTGLGTPNGLEIYKKYKVGNTFPKHNYGFRPSTGPSWPRLGTGVR